MWRLSVLQTQAMLRLPTISDTAHRATAPRGEQSAPMGSTAPDVAGPSPLPDAKPRLRGWLHFGAAPLALVLGLILLVLTPDQDLRAGVAVYVLTTVLLFGVSAAYHLGAGTLRVNTFLRRLDHANIYMFIAGSYTPFAAALPSVTLRWTVLVLVWGIALVGLILRVAWTGAPRWLVTASYLALGWVAIFFLPAFYRDLGAATVALLAIGGVLYSIGGVIYARKRPNPHPEWFGFHELFHAFTIAAYLVQYVAVAMVVTG